MSIVGPIVGNSFDRCERADADVKKGPHCWIQWKGTQVCMDVWCSCGQMSHVDDDFTYHISCGHCGKVWHVCANVRLVEATPDELRELLEDRPDRIVKAAP